MRVLMISQFYPPLLGGEERHVADLSAELAARGHDVSVATLWSEGLPDYEVQQGVCIYRLRGLMQNARWLFKNPLKRQAPPFPDPMLTQSLREVILKERPEIVHAHNWMVHSFLPLKEMSGAKLVLSLHDYSLVCAKKKLIYHDENCTGPGFTKCLECASDHYGAAKGIPVVLSNWVSGYFERKAVDIFLPVSQSTVELNGLDEDHLPYEIIPNFVPDALVDSIKGPDEPRLDELPKEPFLLFVGALGRHKGVDVLLHAYEGLKSPPPLVLIGYETSEYPLSSAALPPNVTVLKNCPHSFVMEAWRRSLAGLAPSTCQETFGIVVIEAMASSRPMIASRIGGLADIVSNEETGYLVPPDDVDALRSAMERLISNPEAQKTMGLAAREKVNLYRASTVVARVEDVYRRLLGIPQSNSQLPKNTPAGVTRKEQQASGEKVTLFHPPWAEGKISSLSDVAVKADSQSVASGWGMLPEVSLLAALGLLVNAAANTLGRLGRPGLEPLFWLSLLILFAPFAYRLASRNMNRRERIGLVLVLGIYCYIFKLLNSPVMFVLPDELYHWRTAQDIIHSGHLFQNNPLLPVSALYPGMEITTSALTSLTGMSIFSSGVWVIGVVRIIFVLALFLFFEEVSHSEQLAGIAVLIYVTNPNFLFFLGAFKYQSLALPFAILLLYALARRERVRPTGKVSYTILILLSLFVVITSHHLTSYALSIFLLVWTVAATILRADKQKIIALASTTIASVIGTVAWLIFVAKETIGYLAPHFTAAYKEVLRLIGSEPDAGRPLFGASNAANATPTWERLIAYLSVVLILIALAYGLWIIGKRNIKNPIVVTLALGAILYPAFLALRFTRSGWEIANRSSEFIYLALSFIVAAGFVNLFQRLSERKSFRGAFAFYTVILMMGGIIAGWPTDWRLAGPYEPVAGARSIDFQGISTAYWMLQNLGPDHSIGTDKTNSMLMGTYGDQKITNTLAGGMNSYWVLYAPGFGEQQLNNLQDEQIEYMVVDQRVFTNAQVDKYFPDVPAPTALRKFDASNLSRIFDNGNILIFDVRRLQNGR